MVCVGVRVRRSKTGLSHRVLVEVSSDACMGGGSQCYIYINMNSYFCLVIFCICILVCFLPRNTSMEEDVSYELA